MACARGLVSEAGARRRSTFKQVGDLRVRKPEPFHIAPDPTIEAGQSPAGVPESFDSFASNADPLDLVDEPRVDAGGLCQSRGRDAAPQGDLQVEDSFWRRSSRLGHQLVVIEQLVGGLGGVRVQARSALFERAERLLQRLREGPADGHHLPYGLHAGSKAVEAAGQLLERPARDLRHDVVDRGLELARVAPVMSLGISSSV